MKTSAIAIALLSVFVLLAPAYARNAANETARVEDATAVLREILMIPENGIPESLLRNAQGIAVIPGLIKAGFIVGGRYGEGVMVVRTPDGGWSNPAFIRLTGGSVGWQIGAQSTDIVLVFRDPRAISAMSRGKFTLGVDASIAAGPVGRFASAATDVELRAEIYSYSRSRGLFAGIALEGAALRFDHGANADFYKREGITPSMIFAGSRVETPAVAGRFSCAVARATLTPMRACA